MSQHDLRLSSSLWQLDFHLFFGILFRIFIVDGLGETIDPPPEFVAEFDLIEKNPAFGPHSLAEHVSSGSTLFVRPGLLAIGQDHNPKFPFAVVG